MACRITAGGCRGVGSFDTDGVVTTSGAVSTSSHVVRNSADPVKPVAAAHNAVIHIVDDDDDDDDINGRITTELWTGGTTLVWVRRPRSRASRRKSGEWFRVVKLHNDDDDDHRGTSASFLRMTAAAATFPLTVRRFKVESLGGGTDRHGRCRRSSRRNDMSRLVGESSCFYISIGGVCVCVCVKRSNYIR